MSIAEGWYPDPAGEAGMRWWDGTRWTEHFHLSAPTPAAAPRPAPRLIRDPTDAELAAADWMRWMGFADATVTQASRDGGIDVDASHAVAQVKAHMTPIGRPALQQLHGVAASLRKTALFFSLMSYTADAKAWAASVGMALFRFNHCGEPEPENDVATWFFSGNGTASVAYRPALQPQPTVSAFRPVRADEYFVAAATDRRHGVTRHDQLLWVGRVWLPLIQLHLDYTVSERRHDVRRSAVPTFEGIDGSILRPQTWQPLQLPADTACLPVRVDAASLSKLLIKGFGALQRSKQPETRQRHARQLNAAGIPTAAKSVAVARADLVLLPVAIACYQTRKGHRIAAWDAAGAPTVDHGLSHVFTQNLSWVAQHAESSGQRLA